MSQRKAVTRQVARRYQSAGRVEKARILDELGALTGWHRDHARKALRMAARPKSGARQRKSRQPRDPVYGPEVLAALRKVWAVTDALCGKRLAPFLTEIVDIADKATLHSHYLTLNPAAIRRETLALSDALAAEITTHYFPTRPYQGLTVAGTSHEATNAPTRAS